jgi:hypothetical protein
MKNEINENPALSKTAVIPSFLHPSSVVKIEHAGELAYLLAWCDFKKINVAGWQRDINNFPIALSLNQVNLGWTDKLDRALYYVSFNDYLLQVNWS